MRSVCSSSDRDVSRVEVLSARAGIGYDRVALELKSCSGHDRARSGTFGNRADRVDLIGSVNPASGIDVLSSCIAFVIYVIMFLLRF